MIEIEKVAENLFDKIRSRFPEIKIGDEKSKSTLDPTKARIFNFDFNDYFTNITVSLVDENNLKIYYDMEAPRGLDPLEKKEWYNFLKNMRFFAQRNGLSFDVRDIAKGGLAQADLKHLNKDAEVVDKDEFKVTESRMYGTSRSSYQKLDDVKIIARHSKPIVDDTNPGARGRNIQALYIENSLGERFRLPEGTTLNGARAHARHVKNGGSIHDEFGKHINKIIAEMNSLKTFVRNMRGRTFEDAETNSMVESAVNYYGKLHRDLFTIRGQRGYEAYRSLWEPEVTEDEAIDIDALRERFVRRVFDDRLLDALPVVKKAYDADRTKIGSEFESWANSVLEAEDFLDKDPNPIDVQNKKHAQADKDLEEDPDTEVNTKSPFANSMDSGAATDDTQFDGESEDQRLENLFNEHGFEYRFQDGVYYFESKEELERAKDIIAAWDPNFKFPRMGIYDYGYGVYGSTTFDREIGGYSDGVKESVDSLLKELNDIKKLSGIR